MNCSRISSLVIALVLAALVASCAADADQATTAPTSVPATAVAGPTPRSTTPAVADYRINGLPDGTNVGIVAFSPPATGKATDWQQRWEEANENAPIGRRQLDWIDVEPTKGDYQLDELRDQLEEVTDRGQAPMVSIIATDVSGTDWPAWLPDTEPETIAAAYNQMLEAVVPVLEEEGVWLLSIANEPPFEDGLDPAAFGRFLAMVRDHGKTLSPNLEITFTFAGGDLFLANDAIGELVQLVDVVAVNHYCLQPDLTVADLNDTEAILGRMVARADGRPVVFQEFGCPAGELLGSSDEFQAAWFAAAFAALDEDPQARAAFVFEFTDWSKQLVGDNYGGAIAAEPALADFFARFEDWLLTTGLLEHDLTPRPAWQVYLDQLDG